MKFKITYTISTDDAASVDDPPFAVDNAILSSLGQVNYETTALVDGQESQPVTIKDINGNTIGAAVVEVI